MRYFHRTALQPDLVLAEADKFLGSKVGQGETGARRRVYRGTVGEVTVTVRAEGGHYTLITLATSNVGESEVDKLAKRFLSIVHTKLDPSHALRGAY